MLRLTVVVCLFSVFQVSNAAAQFDWGSDCDEGSGEFVQYIGQNSTELIGEIPVNKKNVRIYLFSDRDVDIQLFDKETGHGIVQWPSGDLNGATEDTTTYHNVTYRYSGYNGVDGQAGHEFIEILGVTNRVLLMKAFGYAAGDATVRYSWEAVDTCNEKGAGSFSQYVPYQNTTVVGTIPAGKTNIKVSLASSTDVDVQLWDGETPIIAWSPNNQLGALLYGPDEEETQYQNMRIVYSGYNGVDGQLGNEFIEIWGTTTVALTMKAFGYAAGTASVDYEWGIGVGDNCGGYTNIPCDEGLYCKNYQGSAGTCHTAGWCLNDDTAVYDCNPLEVPTEPGEWICEQFQCTWQGPSEVGYDEICDDLLSICAPGMVCTAVDSERVCRMDQGSVCGGLANHLCGDGLICEITGGDSGICVADTPQIECMASQYQNLCGDPDNILPVANVPVSPRMTVSHPGLILQTGDIEVSLEGPAKLTVGQAPALSIGFYNTATTPQTVYFSHDPASDTDPGYEFFGEVVFTNPQGVNVYNPGAVDEYYGLEIAANSSAELSIGITPLKEYYHFEGKGYGRVVIRDAQGVALNMVNLTARVEPAVGTPDTVICGESVFPLVHENDNGGGPFNTLNMGYTYGVCCEEVFYPMAQCCYHSQCGSNYCVDGRCMEKRTAETGARGEYTVLLGYDFSADDTCQVTPLPAELANDFLQINGFFDYMAALYMGKELDFIDFTVTTAITLPAAMRDAINSSSDIAPLFEQYCPEIDLAAYDIKVLDNQVSELWVSGLAFRAAMTVLYGQTGGNIATAVHEIGHLFECNDLYMDLSGSLQWYNNLYGRGRYDTINPTINAGDFNQLGEDVLNLCRGRMGWVDADGNGLFDIDE